MTEPRIGEELDYRHPSSSFIRRVKIVGRRGQGTMWLAEDVETGEMKAVSIKHLSRA